MKLDQLDVNLTKTHEGYLLTWERGTTRYTIGCRITRTVKRWYVARWQIVVRPFAAHFTSWPMTEVEKRHRKCVL